MEGAEKENGSSPNRMIRSALITGPTGAIGTALCELLSKRGIHVYGVVHPGSKRIDHLRKIKGIDIVECDASDYPNLPIVIREKCNAKQGRQITNVDAFFHLAWAKTTGSGRNDMKSQINNIRYTVDAVQAASELGCSVFIGAGSQAEYGRVNDILSPFTPCFPENGYGMAKLCAGQMSRVECERNGIAHIWPRILSVYGPYDGEGSLVSLLIRNLLNGERIGLTAGEQVWDYLYSEDAAEALYRLAISGKDGGVYPIGSGIGKPLKEFIEDIRDEIDPSLPLDFGKIPYGEKQVMHLVADISALTEDTGFMPLYDFRMGIEKTIEWARRYVSGGE